MYAKYNLTVGASLAQPTQNNNSVGISLVGNSPVESERLCMGGASTPASQSLLCNP